MQTRMWSMEKKMTEEKEVEMKTKPLQLVTSVTTRPPPTTAAKACCAQSAGGATYSNVRARRLRCWRSQQ
jgi:hypothetical protein